MKLHVANKPLAAKIILKIDQRILFLGNKLGDVCETDTDGDGVSDLDDFCPKNKAIQRLTMLPYTSVNLDPAVTSLHPEWEVTHEGQEVKVKGGTEIPVLNMSAILVGKSLSIRASCCLFLLNFFMSR